MPISQCPPAHSSVSSRSTTPTLLHPSGNRKRKAATNDTVDAAIADILTEKTKVLMKKRTAAVEEKEDDIGHIMKSMATTIRKLPTRARADVKYGIHGVVHEAEMMYLFHNENYDNPSPFSVQDRPATCSPYASGGVPCSQAASTCTTGTTEG